MNGFSHSSFSFSAYFNTFHVDVFIFSNQANLAKLKLKKRSYNKTLVDWIIRLYGYICGLKSWHTDRAQLLWSNRKLQWKPRNTFVVSDYFLGFLCNCLGCFTTAINIVTVNMNYIDLTRTYVKKWYSAVHFSLFWYNAM